MAMSRIAYDKNRSAWQALRRCNQLAQVINLP